jgi:prolyl-tRNA editing enzyme YbaK/EbsC (Cys-tRNA(Pro) deacylase)
MSKHSETPATMMLKEHGVSYGEHIYDYVEHGGCSPFGLRKPMPVYMQKSVLDIERIYINGGKRGFLVSMPPSEIVRVVKPTLVDVALIE